MKKLAYAKPAIRVIRLCSAAKILQGSPGVKQIDNTEGFVFDNNGLDTKDELR